MTQTGDELFVIGPIKIEMGPLILVFQTLNGSF